MSDHPSVTSKKYLLSANDRCDQCSAEALIKIKGVTGELTFCNHHYEKIMNNPLSYKKIIEFGIEFIDERDKIIKNKPIGGM
jgi:hypothetical protein